jgi:UDP-2,4-diacetamido-2,4,6-trideoxy-beta-L-altropyranose hydrolase
MTHLLIRTDAGSQIGTGHVMRCLALAEAWQNTGGHALFAMATEAPALEARLKSEGMEVVHLSTKIGHAEDAVQTVELAHRAPAIWIVVDGYQFGANYQRIIKDSLLRLLAIDDVGHAEHYYADIVLNQNLHAKEGLHARREAYTRLLLGNRYVLLRREFLKWRGWKREIPDMARKLLVTLGGSDPDNVTLKVILAIQGMAVDGLEAVVVAGPSSARYEELQSAIQASQAPLRLARDVMDMSEWMAWADVAISTGGSTCWELAFMGLPSVLLVLAENQRGNAEGLDEAGVSVNLGWHESLSANDIALAVSHLLVAAKARGQMARRGQELIDGQGAARVLMASGIRCST